MYKESGARLTEAEVASLTEARRHMEAAASQLESAAMKAGAVGGGAWEREAREMAQDCRAVAERYAYVLQRGAR